MSRIDARLKNLEGRVKRCEDLLELSPSIASFDWEGFSPRDKDILNVLLQKGHAGETSTKISEILNMVAPETSGRVKVYRSLKRIERISRKLRSYPIVLYERKKWSLNYDDWQFNIKTALGENKY